MKLNQYLTFPVTLVLFILMVPAQGQIIDKTENKAKRKTNQRVDNKIDKGIDSGLDAIEGLFKRKDKDKKKNKKEEKQEQEAQENQAQDAEQSQEAMNMFGAEPGDVEDSYSFDHSVDLKTAIYNKKGKLENEVDMTMFISDSEPVFGMKSMMEQGSATMIFEMDESRMITMSDAQGGQKMGMVMKFDPEDMEDMNEENPNSEVTFTKTGRTKSIAGYHSEEYQMHNNEADDDYEYFMWMTQEHDLNWIDAFSEMSKHQKMERTQMAEEYPQGMMMQMVSKSTKSDEKNVTTVENVNMNSDEDISTDGYQFISMGSGGRR